MTAELSPGLRKREVGAVYAAGLLQGLALVTFPAAGVAHQAGTCRFGDDPASSVLDVNCKAHELDNLYVVDTSFYPSIGAVNPALTAIANALRVGDHMLDRMGARTATVPAPPVTA